MPLIETATTYVLDAILQNEEFKKFPQDFIGASVRWVRSWFLEDDPKTEAKLTAPDKSVDYKKGVVESKLEDLLENPKFKQELESKLAEYEHHAAQLPSVSNRTNTIENSTINTGGGDFSQISQNYQAGGNFQIVNNYYQHATPGTPRPVAAIAGLKAELRNLIAKGNTGDVVAKLADLGGQSDDFHNTALQLSGKWAQLKRQEMMGILNYSEANIERSRISASALGLMGELPD